jgi:hypothetical protein
LTTFCFNENSNFWAFFQKNMDAYFAYKKLVERMGIFFRVMCKKTMIVGVFLIEILTPKGPRVFLLKIANKQPLLKASQIVKN